MFGEYVQPLIFAVLDVGGKPWFVSNAAYGQRSRRQGAILGLLRAHGQTPLPERQNSIRDGGRHA